MGLFDFLNFVLDCKKDYDEHKANEVISNSAVIEAYIQKRHGGALLFISNNGKAAAENVTILLKYDEKKVIYHDKIKPFSLHPSGTKKFDFHLSEFGDDDIEVTVTWNDSNRTDNIKTFFLQF